MKQPSLTDRIERFFKSRQNEWVSGKFIEQLAISKNLKGSTASRRLREAESGIGSNGKRCKKFLERRETTKGYVEYRYIAQPKTIYTTEVINGIAYSKQKVVLV